MANDDLINAIAGQIKAKEDGPATAQQIQLHKMEFIKANCQVWFKEFADELASSSAKLNSALAGSASAAPEIVVTRTDANQITVSKADFPCTGTTCYVDANGLSLTASVRHSLRATGAPTSANNYRGTFDVNADNALYLRLQIPTAHPTTFLSGSQFSDFIVKSMFSV